MKAHYRAVVIGGGVVGASVLYHLAKFGWSDVALIERAELTAGSTWHAAAGFHALNADPNIAALQDYTIQLYPEIEAESGQSCGLHMTGGVSFASTPDRWEWLQSAWAVFQAIGVETSRLVTPEEIHAMNPLLDMTGIKGGLHDVAEGYLDPNGTTHAYAKAAQKRGADVILRNRVLSIAPLAGGGFDLMTEQGPIFAENVVNAGGLWAKQVGRMVGLDLPVTPMEHHYLVTESLPELADRRDELPVTVDLDGFSYARQEQKGYLLGVYERNPRHWQMEGAPWDYGMELIPEDIDRIAPELEIAFARYPSLQRAGIKRWINGAFTFTPDGNPLVGPVGPRGYWVACGVMAGFSQGGGVGKALAEWMIHGTPAQDVYGMDVARYGAFHANRDYLRQTTGQFYSRRFVMTFPNEQLPAARPLKTAPAHAEMTAAGCRWGVSWGLEVPLYFAPSPDFVETGSLRRSEAFPVIGAECQAVRQAAGLLDISGFSRFEVSGAGAAAWLDRLLACSLPKAGRARLAPMLAEDGRLKGDLTVFNWGDGTYWLMGSYYLRSFHLRWFADHAAANAAVRDISDDVVGFSINGPCAREVLERLTGPVGLPLMGCAEMDVGMLRAKVARLSLSGELAYEINCPAAFHSTLRRQILAAGADLGLREIGFAAMLSLRLEKSFGIWNAEFGQSYTPAMTGLDRWIAADKGDFIGRSAYLAAAPPERRIVMLEVDATDADCSGFEPIWLDGQKVGFTTSGGYGHSLKRSFALGQVRSDLAVAGTELGVHVVGQLRKAVVIDMSPYDPEGERMRA